MKRFGIDDFLESAAEVDSARQASPRDPSFDKAAASLAILVGPRYLLKEVKAAQNFHRGVLVGLRLAGYRWAEMVVSDVTPAQIKKAIAARAERHGGKPAASKPKRLRTVS